MRFPVLSLLLLPVLAWYFRPAILLTEFIRAEYVTVKPADTSSAAGERRQLIPRVEGTDSNASVYIPPGHVGEVQLPQALQVYQLSVQAAHDDTYSVQGFGQNGQQVVLWQVPQSSAGVGLFTRQSAILMEAPIVRTYTLLPTDTNGSHFSDFTLEYVYQRISTPLLLICVFWGLFGVCFILQQSTRVAHVSRAVQKFWCTIDPWLVSLIGLVLIFKIDSAVTVGVVLMALGSALLYGLILLLRHFSLVLAFNVVFCLGALCLAASLYSDQVSQELLARHSPTVDHRLVPNGDEVNEDRIRFRGTAAAIEEEDFNIIFLGDSFTEGLFVSYEQAYPYYFEKQAAQLQCKQKIRSINFGWASSSPLLSLRLLRDIGEKYKPDLVILNLDMTDFHDDLFAQQLFDSGTYTVSLNKATILSTAIRGLRLYQHAAGKVRKALVARSAEAPLSTTVPHERFFITNQPLAESVPYIRKGVLKNIDRLHRFTTEELQGNFMLVMYPRGFQYSKTESPENWEASAYSPLGPHVLAPFQFFQSEAAALPYPFISLLQDFTVETRFPLFLHDDPHWNQTGHAVAAEALLRHLVEGAHIPCAYGG